ncbi:hypothetical protein Hanom_Chr03g00271001 [Helianthus anomalus]
MTSSMAFLSSTPTKLPSFSPSSKTHFPINPFISLKPQRYHFASVRAAENGSGAAVVVEEKKDSEVKAAEEGNGAPVAAEVEEVGVKFEDPKWVSGTWDLKQFQKDGATDWDAVIDAVQLMKMILILNSCSNRSRCEFSLYVLCSTKLSKIQQQP